MQAYTPRLIKDAREWLTDCFPDSAELIALCTDPEIVTAVHNHYDGGWREFVRTNTEPAIIAGLWRDITEGGAL